MVETLNLLSGSHVARHRLFCPTGVLEIDPCFAWSQQVVAGVGVAEDVRKLYGDMHTYLAGQLLHFNGTFGSE